MSNHSAFRFDWSGHLIARPIGLPVTRVVLADQDVQNGEGVYGLRRALVLAGAQTQVTSLWKVSDEATRTLMVNFCQRLLDGEGRSAALRHAQLLMLADPALSRPYYWASFVPIGNWAPLSAHQKHRRSQN